MKTLKEKLRDRDELSGMHICLTEPCISEMCAGLGYDFLWIIPSTQPLITRCCCTI